MAQQKHFALAVCALRGLSAIPVQAQDDASLRGMLRACAGISDVPARVACYDAIPTEQPTAAAVPAPQPAPRPAGFGSSQLAAARAPLAAEADSIEGRVVAAVQRQPGIQLLTLEDGAQWLFVEGAPQTYNPPRPGSTVEIRSASMGGYMLRYQDQPAVRVRRVR